MLSTILLDLTCLSRAGTRTRGIGRYAADLARAVAERARSRGDGFRVLAIERLDWTGPGLVTADVDGAVSRLQAADRTLPSAAWGYRVRLRLAATARRSGADLVHSLEPDATPLGRLGCARIVTCHDLIGLAFPAHYLNWKDGWRVGRRLLDGRRYGRADHVIAVSETTARDLVATLGIPARRITVVRSGVDLTRFSAAPAAADAGMRDKHGLAGRPYLLYVGAGDWRKNPEGMIAALAILRRRAGADGPVLAWAARLDAEEIARVRRLAADRGMDDSVVRLLGWIPDAEVAALMRGAAALLLVSRLEGFGYPIVEAMASGCPVIAADRPASVEIAGDAALLVDPERPEAIADAATMLLRDDRERRRLIDRGLARCRAFDVRRMADETLDVYQRVLSAAVARS